MKVGIYARVSTKDKGQDVSSQFVQMNEYCQHKGWDTVQYQDEESGKLEAEAAREGLDRMLADLKSGQIDGAVITDQRRFARSVELGMRLVRTIRQSGKFLEVVQSNLHVDSEHYGQSEMMQMVLGFMLGEADNMQHAADVKRGIDAKKKKHAEQGREWRWGRKCIDIDTVRVLSLHKDGQSLRAIAESIGCSTAPVRRILKEATP